MIDTISVANDTQVLNKGEGVPSPPPSSPEIKSSGSNQPAAKVDLREQISRDSNTLEERTESLKKETEDAQEQRLKDTVDSLNEKLNKLDLEVMFKIDKKINKNYISVIDKGSQEIIREFPPKDIRTFIARFDEINEKLMVTPDVKSMIVNFEV